MGMPYFAMDMWAYRLFKFYFVVRNNVEKTSWQKVLYLFIILGQRISGNVYLTEHLSWPMG